MFFELTNGKIIFIAGNSYSGKIITIEKSSHETLSFDVNKILEENQKFG